MTPPTEEVDGLLLEMSAKSAYERLVNRGYRVSRSALEARLTELVRAGLRRPMVRPTADSEPAPYSRFPRDGEASAKLGCETLLRAHLRTGKHWISDPARFAEACASVGLSA